MTLQSALLHMQEKTGCNAFFAVQDFTSGEVLAVHEEDTPVSSASLIKLPLFQLGDIFSTLSPSAAGSSCTALTYCTSPILHPLPTAT